MELSGQNLEDGSPILSGDFDVERIFEIAALARTANLEAILHYERFVSLLEDLRWEDPDSRSVSRGAWRKRERLVEFARSSLLHTVLSEIQSSASERSPLSMRHTLSPEFPFATLEEELEGWEAAAGIYPGEIFPELVAAASEEIVWGLGEAFLSGQNVSLVSAARRLCMAFGRAASEREIAVRLAKSTIDRFVGESLPASASGCVAELEKAFGSLVSKQRSRWWLPGARARASA